jgi:hypothetical protein
MEQIMQEKQKTYAVITNLALALDFGRAETEEDIKNLVSNHLLRVARRHLPTLDIAFLDRVLSLRVNNGHTRLSTYVPGNTYKEVALDELSTFYRNVYPKILHKNPKEFGKLGEFLGIEVKKIITLQ